MSVPEYRRNEGKFEVLNRALDLCCYTLKITSNKKVFLAEYDGSITNDIIRCAKDIYIKAWIANNVIVRQDLEGKDNLLRRLSLQEDSIQACTQLLSYINIAQQIFHLKTKRMNYWIDSIINVRFMLRQWKENDRKRYKSFLGL